MNRPVRHPPWSRAGAALLLAAGPAICFGRALPMDLAALAPCAGPEHRQFDFWAGDWDAYDVDDPGKPVAHVKVDPMLGGCALREVYEGVNGLIGESFSIYDASRKLWHQTWVTNRGQLLVLEGTFRDGRMTLRATEISADGRQVLWRGVWIPGTDGVRETAETSDDGGKNWKPRFDLLFRRHKP
jgi:hypothetical protein